MLAEPIAKAEEILELIQLSQVSIDLLVWHELSRIGLWHITLRLNRALIVLVSGRGEPALGPRPGFGT